LQLWHSSFDQVRGPLESFPGKRVMDLIGWQTIVLVPLTGASMQDKNLIGLLHVKDICKEMVIPIPVPLIIEWHKEKMD
jgi:hypothetical protein